MLGKPNTSTTTNNDIFASTSVKLTPTETKDISKIQQKMEEIAQKHPEYFAKGFHGVEAVSMESSYMSTSMDGKISVNFGVDKNGFNAGESLVSAFEKLSSGVELTEQEEYSIEVLWHEILHNKSKNTTVLPGIDEVNVGFTRVIAETINQLVARHTYGLFLRQLGGKQVHKDWIMNNGYGYSATVDNLRLLLKQAGFNEKVFVNRANAILMTDYTDMDKKIKALLKEMNMKKRRNTFTDSDLLFLFDKIELGSFADYL